MILDMIALFPICTAFRNSRTTVTYAKCIVKKMLGLLLLVLLFVLCWNGFKYFFLFFSCILYDLCGILLVLGANVTLLINFSIDGHIETHTSCWLYSGRPFWAAVITLTFIHSLWPYLLVIDANDINSLYLPFYRSLTYTSTRWTWTWYSRLISRAYYAYIIDGVYPAMAPPKPDTLLPKSFGICFGVCSIYCLHYYVSRR